MKPPQTARRIASAVAAAVIASMAAAGEPDPQKLSIRIEAQPIKMIIAQPHQSVIAYKTPNFIAVRSVEIYRLPPRRDITLGEIRPKAPQIIPRRSQVVVNDIKNHC